MKLLFDQNLSPELPRSLEDLFPGSIHVRSVGLECANDRTVWEYALEHEYVIATKDSDFFSWAVLQPEVKVIWVATGNSSTPQIEFTFREQHNLVEESLQEGQAAVFVLVSN